MILDLFLQSISPFINYISSYYSWVIVLAMSQISFIIFYSTNFKLSSSSLIRYIQVLFIISIPLFILSIYLLLIHDSMVYPNVVCNIDDINIGTKVEANGHVHINDEKSGMAFAATGAIVGVSAAMAKSVAKSPMPPIQKVGFVAAGAIVGGAVSVVSNYANRALSGASGTSVSSNVSKFIGDSQLSPLQGMLFWLEIIDYACLSIVYLLIIQLVFKLYFKDSISLNLSKLLGDNFNVKVEYYLNKIIKWNKKMSVMWIWFGSVILIFGISSKVYFVNFMSIHSDKIINSHNSVNNKIVTTFYPSIQDGLFNLMITNYVSLVIIIGLIIILLRKFHFNKDISNIYIWILVVILIITLAFSGYIFNELYTNLDSYVNIYNSINK